MTTSLIPAPAMDIHVDVVIVGAGPAGLAAAIRIKHLAPEVSVCVLEKGRDSGAHQLSGALVPAGLLAELFAQHRAQQKPPAATPVVERQWCWLNAQRRRKIPEAWLPPSLRHADEALLMISLGQWCRWLAVEAQALGVEVCPAQAVVAGCYNAAGALIGVQTGAMGRLADGSPGPRYEPGITIGAAYTLVAEGARGSLTGELDRRYALSALAAPQRYAMGFKEHWHCDEPRWTQGQVIHTLGWPLNSVAGGGFLYASSAHDLELGLIVQLDYRPPDFNPFACFEAYKHHPWLTESLHGATRTGFGARTLAEGGWQSLGALTFSGGALLGCAAGLLDLRRQQGIAQAVRSGLLAAQSCVNALKTGRRHDALPDYAQAVTSGTIGQAMQQAQAIKPALGRLGGRWGPLYVGAAYWLRANGSGLPRWHDARADHQLTQTNANALSTREEDAPPLSRARDQALALAHLHPGAGPSHLLCVHGNTLAENLPPLAQHVLQHCCPGGVYQTTDEGLRLQTENCLHCKGCEIKDPSQQVRWTPPEAGSGPRYRNL